MKRIQYYSYGGPDTMKLEDFELKRPGPGEVAVKVAFTAINPIDWKVRNGYLKMVTGKTFPRAMGSDFSGTVTAVGASSTFHAAAQKIKKTATDSGLGRGPRPGRPLSWFCFRGSRPASTPARPHVRNRRPKSAAALHPSLAQQTGG